MFSVQKDVEPSVHSDNGGVGGSLCPAVSLVKWKIFTSSYSLEVSMKEKVDFKDLNVVLHNKVPESEIQPSLI